MESWADIRSAQAPGASVMTPMCTPGPRAPLVKLQHSGNSPRTQAGQGGSMPRGPQVSHGLSTTRWPTSTPRASGPSSTTSVTTSWPGTWGREEKADIGLSMSPSLKSPRTSLASDPQIPDRIGLVITQSGRTRRASGTSWRPKGILSSSSSTSSAGPGRDGSFTGGSPNTSAFIGRFLSGRPLGCPPFARLVVLPHGSASPMARIPAKKPSMSAVFISTTAFMSGR